MIAPTEFQLQKQFPIWKSLQSRKNTINQIGLNTFSVPFVKFGGIVFNLGGAQIVHTSVKSHVLFLCEDNLFITCGQIFFKFRNSTLFYLLPTSIKLGKVINLVVALSKTYCLELILCV